MAQAMPVTATCWLKAEAAVVRPDQTKQKQTKGRESLRERERQRVKTGKWR